MRSPICELFGIEHPVVQGALGPWTSTPLTAAICEAGALGSVGTATLDAAAVRRLIGELRERTDRPFAVNFTVRPFDEEAFAATLELSPAVVSVALGEPRELVKRAHDAGAKFLMQVTTAQDAARAAEQGVDAIIAQGTDGGGFGGRIGTMVLVPQVVDAVAPLPVLAAGGIVDGRGAAAAAALGAVGVNCGTVFLSATEFEFGDYREMVLAAGSGDAVKVEFSDAVMPPANRDGAFAVHPRAIRTPFVDRWSREPPGDEARAAIREALEQRRIHELIPFAGQSAGLIREARPSAAIVADLVSGLR